MTVTPLRPRPPARAYTDVLGREWAIDKLDALLADPGVRETVLRGVGLGLQPGKTWLPGRVYGWAWIQYGRETTAALLLPLVTPFLDTEGAHYLGRKPVR